MGFGSALRLVRDVEEARPALAQLVAASPVAALTQTGIRSPWSVSALQAIPWSDVLGGSDQLGINRADALTIPAVSRGVQLITAAAARCPIKAYQGADEIPAPTWAYRSDAAASVPPQLRTALITEDLVLSGWSLCLATKGGGGQLLTLDRVPPHLWGFAGDMTIQVDGADIPAQYVPVLIKGPSDGLLTTGRRTLRGALNVEAAWQRAVRNPSAHTVLQQVTDDELEDDEIDALLASYVAARQAEDGAVSYIPAALKVETVGEILPDLLTEARNAVAVDVARHLGLPAVAIDAGPTQSSLTYANAQTQGGLAVSVQGVQPYLDAIGWRLSMDDVVPRGTRIALDSTDLNAEFASMTRTGTETRD